MLESFGRGLVRASRSWAMVLVLLAASIFFALPVVAPIFLLVARTSAGTFIPYRMLADRLDPIWLIDLANERLAGASLVAVIGQAALVIGVMAFFYLLANVLFAGGILGVYDTPDGRFSHARFWAGAGRYFPRFLRLWLFSLVCYGLVIAGYLLILIPINAADARASVERSGAIRHWVATGALMLVLAVVNLVFDYARIGAVVNDSRRMFRELIRAARFSYRHFWRVFGLYLMLAIVGAAVFGILVALRGTVKQTSLGTVLIAVILGQLAVGGRWWSRLSFYAAQLDLYRRFAPPAESPATPDVETPDSETADSETPVFAKAVDTSELPPLPTPSEEAGKEIQTEE